MVKLHFNKLLTKKITKSVTALLIAGGCLTILGCSDSKPKAEPAAPKQAAVQQQDIYPYEPVTEVKAGRKNIYATLKVVKGPYWSELVRGLKEGGNAANVNVYVGGPVIETNWQAQKSMLDSLADKKVEAIILSPCDSNNIIPVATQLKEKKLPVILVDTILKDKVYDAAYATNNVAAGSKAAAEMLVLLRKQGIKEDEKATVAIAASSLNSQTLVDRANGIKKYWQQHAPKNWQLQPDVLVNYSDPKLAQNLAAEAVKKNADLRGFISVNNGSTVNTCKYLQASKSNNICIVGFDYSEEIASFLANPKMTAASIVQNQYNMGYEAVKTAVQMINGSKPSKQDIDTGVRIVTNANYKDFAKKN